MRKENDNMRLSRATPFSLHTTLIMFRIRKIAMGLLLGLFAVWVLTSAWISHSYSVNLPKSPEEKTGRIYSIFVGGGTRYGSEREIHIFKALEHCRPVAFSCFLIAVVVGLVSGDIKIASGRKLNE